MNKNEKIRDFKLPDSPVTFGQMVYRLHTDTRLLHLYTDPRFLRALTVDEGAFNSKRMVLLQRRIKSETEAILEMIHSEDFLHLLKPEDTA